MRPERRLRARCRRAEIRACTARSEQSALPSTTSEENAPGESACPAGERPELWVSDSPDVLAYEMNSGVPGVSLSLTRRWCGSKGAAIVRWLRPLLWGFVLRGGEDESEGFFLLV